MSERLPLASRFRGFMPVVIDVECGGFNPNTDALLEIAAVLIELQPDGRLAPGESWRFHVQSFEGREARAGVAGGHRHRSVPSAAAGDPGEGSADALFKEVRQAMKENDCTRAILVGHNASFDLDFLNAAVARTEIKRNPFHPFSSFDTATLAGVVSARRCSARRYRRRESAGIRTKRIPRRTTRSARPSCSARCATASTTA